MSPDETRLCPDCGEAVIPDRAARCAPCRRERQRLYDREYTRRPEVRVRQTAYMRAYQQRPDVKERHRAAALASYYRRHPKRDPRQCLALRTNGERCNANSMVGQALCFAHSRRRVVHLVEVAS